MVVLAVGAHPDDLEINCYGTLAKYVKLGHNVVACTLSNGNMGHYTIMPDELRKIRRVEAENAAATIGARYVCADYGDAEIDPADKGLRNKLIEIIRDVNPDVIITHDPSDYMPDHVNAYHIVFYSAFVATLPHYNMDIKGDARVVPIFLMENTMGVNFVPTEYVDITDEIDKKIEAVSCHKSQIVWLKEHDNFDMPRYISISAEYRGVQCGVKYAEGFKQCNVWPRLRTTRILP